MTRLMISCGEPSGDLYAGALVAALRGREPDIDVFGLGGERLQAAGGRLIADFDGLSVTGLTEALRVLPRSWATMKALVEAARARKPDALVVIDYPDFNFRLMRAVKQLGVPVIYYVSPQLWAWRAGRIKTMKKVVDRVLPIFPFEEAIYRRESMDVRFVGHPLIDLARPTRSRDAFLRGLHLDPAAPVVALLPGSRPNELTRLAPVLIDAAPLDRRAGSRRPVRRRPRAAPRRSPVRRLRPARRHPAHRRGPDRRCAEGERCGGHRVGHGDGADGAARQADGRALQAVAADLPARQAAGAASTCMRWST